MFDIVKKLKDGRVHILLYTPDIEELPVELFEIYSTAEYTGLDGITTNYILIKDSDSEELVFVVKEEEEISGGSGSSLIKTEIDDTNVSNQTTYSSKKIVEEIEDKIEVLKTSQSLEYEGENITCENTLISRTSDTLIKGQTYQNLILGKKSSSNINYENGVITSQIIPTAETTPAIQLNLLNAKINQKYTFLCNVTENKNNVPLMVGGTNAQHEIMVKNELKKGINKIVFTSKSTLTDNITLPIWFTAPANVQQSIEIKNLTLLEGDWTDKEVPAGITGIESVGERENKISVLSHNENLYDNNSLINALAPKNPNRASTGLLKVKPSETYYLDILDDIIGDYGNNSLAWVKVAGYGFDKQLLNTYIVNSRENQLQFTIPDNIYYIEVIIDAPIERVSKSRIMLILDKNITNYISHEEDKKEILLPIEGGLKSLPNGVCDTIEQRADGVYLVQRVKKETYADGDENNNNYLTDNIDTYKPLETPIETKLDIQNLHLETYKDVTYITTDNAIQPVLNLKIPRNIGSIIQANTESINKLYKLIDEVIIPQLVANSADIEILKLN